MTQKNERPVAAGRGNCVSQFVLGDSNNNNSPRDAVARLPEPVHRRYTHACSVWQRMYRHHQIIKHLLSEARP
jgi:hypothetical protein